MWKNQQNIGEAQETWGDPAGLTAGEATAPADRSDCQWPISNCKLETRALPLHRQSTVGNWPAGPSTQPNSWRLQDSILSAWDDDDEAADVDDEEDDDEDDFFPDDDEESDGADDEEEDKDEEDEEL